MKIHLRPFTQADIPSHQTWCREIHAEQYTSRTTPHAYLDQGLFQSAALLWLVIEVDQHPSGHLWLEKDDGLSQTATLGILLGKTDQLGKGIGRQAIQQVLQTAAAQNFATRILLNVRKSNPRAIACYQHCGFTISGEGFKQQDGQTPIPFYKMQLTLKHFQDSV